MKKKSIGFLFAAAVLFGALGAVMPVSAKISSRADIFVPVSGVASVEEAYTAPAYLNSNKGIFIRTNANAATVRYRGVLDARRLTKDLRLVSLYALGGEDSAIITEMNINLIDTENEENIVGMRFRATSVGDNSSYVLVYSGGRYRGYNSGSIYENDFGAVAWGSSFYPERSGSVVPFQCMLDYESRQFWNRNNANTVLVLDMDDPDMVGSGGEWRGFEKDTCYFEIKLTLTSSVAGGVVIQEFLGQDMRTALGSDIPTPEITVEYEGDALPVGALGVSYPIPDATAFDWYDGARKTELRLARIDGTAETDLTERVRDGAFSPETEGNYAVFYEIENSLGGRAAKRLDFKVAKLLPQYNFYFPGGLTLPELGGFFFVPECSVSGGSGRLAVTEEIRYNGRTVGLGAERRILCDEPGMIEIKITASGYCGEPFSRVYGIRVENPDAKILLLGHPEYVKKGAVTNLPASRVAGSDVSGAELVVTADGIEVSGETFRTDKAAGEKVSLLYQLKKGTEVLASELLTLTVIDPAGPAGYPVAVSGSPVIAADSQGVSVSASGDFCVKMPFPIACNQAAVTFSFAGDAESVDILLEDDRYPQVSNFLRVSRRGSAFVLSLNGRGAEVQVSGDFSGTRNFGVIIDRNTGNVLNAAGKKLLSARLTESGIARVSLRANGVKGDAALCLVQVGNQKLLGSNQAPELLTSADIPTYRYLSFGETFEVYAAEAFDVFDYGGEVSMKVSAPDRSVLYEGISADKTFRAEQYGVYIIDYVLTDASGRSATRKFLVNVPDELPPEIAVEVPARAKAGEDVILPKPAVRDNLDETCTGYLTVRRMRTFESKVIYASEVSEWRDMTYRFEETGIYEVIYSVSDKAGNLAVRVCRITVE